MRPESREQSHDPDLVGILEKATGVFMTGGNQLKLSAIVCGTPVGDAIVAAHERGVVVGGTSAGAASSPATCSPSASAVRRRSSG